MNNLLPVLGLHSLHSCIQPLHWSLAKKRNNKYKGNIKVDSCSRRRCRYGSIRHFGTSVCRMFRNSLRVGGCYFLQSLVMMRSNYP